ncbi:MAG TPA: NAD(P)/FAD-dependent oxidoreductase [Verrucomicrobiota bacterium]|nr:NAD(P)/FAD-dependent oxidoreductase [Verrucomicrobiota bacterium]
MTRPRILVLGAGFGGLTFCQAFRHPAADVIVVDRQNHHLFQPLLYQVATAGLSAPEIAQPIRSILRDRPNVSVRLGHVEDIRPNEKVVVIEGTTVSYDYLVFGLGGRTSYFGHPEWEQFAPGLKSLEDAQRIRREILLAFEQAENTDDPEEQRRLMTVVVVGGGPTGVELAGAFAELTRHVLRRDFRRIDPTQARVILVEGSARILNQFSEALSMSAEEQLAALGVEIHCQVKVQEITRGRVTFSTGETLEAGNIIWAAGVAASPLTTRLDTLTDRAGRVLVNPDLSVPGHPEVFVIGDAASLTDSKGQPVPGVSPAAMQAGRHVARLIEDELEGRPHRVPFDYWDKGSMATIGRSAAVAKIGGLEFSGYPAWLAWLLIHLVFLIGFRNRIAVLWQWFYSYVTYKRGARIITGLKS